MGGEGPGDFAVRETANKIKLFKNFKEANIIKTSFPAEGIFAGTLLGVKGADCVVFYDWNTCSLVRRIDVDPKEVYWNNNGDTLSIVTDDSFFVLSFNGDAVQAAIERGDPGGAEDAFDLLH